MRIKNLAGRVAADASALYACNLVAFASLLLKEGALKTDLDDEILQATLVTYRGEIVHPTLRRSLSLGDDAGAIVTS